MLKTFCIWLGLCTTISGPARIIDGDSLVVAGYHIRLQGLDAEELHEPHGWMARQALIELVRGHTVTCRLSGYRSYHRQVATCYSQSIDLAEAMIASGYALDCAHYSHGKYRHFEPDGIRLKLISKPYC